MTIDLEKIKEKIRALKRLATNDAAAVGEVANAMKAAQALANQYNLKLAEIDETEQVKYRTAIKNYYFTKLIDIKTQLRKLTLISIVFMLASSVIFACSAFIPFLSSTPVINEFVIVIGWVFAWEAVDLFCIQRNQINIEKMRYTNLMYAKITYEKLDKK